MYLVYFDGYNSYGVSYYLIGLYSTEDEANAAANHAREQIKEEDRDDYPIKVLYIQPGITHDVVENLFFLKYRNSSRNDGYKSDVFLGGYEE